MCPMFHIKRKTFDRFETIARGFFSCSNVAEKTQLFSSYYFVWFKCIMDLVDVILAHKMNTHFAFHGLSFFFKGRNLIRVGGTKVLPYAFWSDYVFVYFSFTRLNRQNKDRLKFHFFSSILIFPKKPENIAFREAYFILLSYIRI